MTLSISRLDENGRPYFRICKRCNKEFEEVGFKKHVRQMHG